nr:MAG TPA: hypothetical protein [Caudoviricetes sp.]
MIICLCHTYLTILQNGNHLSMEMIDYVLDSRLHKMEKYQT